MIYDTLRSVFCSWIDRAGDWSPPKTGHAEQGMDLPPVPVLVPCSHPWSEWGSLCLLSPCFFPAQSACGKRGISARWAQDSSLRRAALSAAVHFTSLLARSHGRVYACDQAPLSSFFFFFFFTTPPPPPWAASWWQGVSTVSRCEGAGLYSFSWRSRAPLGTSNRALSHGFVVLVSASAPFLPVAWGLQLSSHLFIWPSFVLVSLALIWFPLAQDLNVSQYLIYLSSHMQTHTHTCEVRKYHQSCCTDGECSMVIG